uniref:Uncharacterized protein LOC104213663 n=1 Tax=Nicotiana sylvestris TaxID=4096 RepID=A0A1U7V948_NICSY|nr:PREDICTED: uncharacterized protein LOC104213663 [Nicotiana sylvestris]
MCEPIFMLLKKDAAIRWTDDCQKAFDRIKDYLSKPPVLVPPEPGCLEGNWDCLVQPGFIRGHRIKDEKAEAQVKYNQLHKRIRESESEHHKIQESNQKLIKEWKDMAISANKRLVDLE